MGNILGQKGADGDTQLSVAATTTDTSVMVKTTWLDHDGTPLPQCVCPVHLSATPFLLKNSRFLDKTAANF